jgi:NAD(P)-dependent dehydrogenase (short-subunit alcohol dehydrogenase family)
MADAHSKPVWFITGCSTGFGRELSVILLKRGYRVVVTARDKAKVDDIVAGHDKNGLALALDVDKQKQIDAAVKAAEARFGRIDVLVNNAGYGYLAAIEEGDDSDVRAMFDTNFFGLAAMTRAVLPIMRAQKSGAIVNISSIGGFIGFPGSGYYAATKFAVEGLSEALSKEVAPLGIKVIIVEPGPFRTDWAGRSLKTPKKPVDAYTETAIARRRQIQGVSGSQAGDPVRASEAIITAVEQQHSPLRCRLAPSRTNPWGRRLRPCARSTRRSRPRRAARIIRRPAERRASRRLPKIGAPAWTLAPSAILAGGADGGPVQPRAFRRRSGSRL